MACNPRRPEEDPAQHGNHKGCNCPGAGEFSDRMLEAVQTAVVFFDTDGVIYRTNSLARQDLQAKGNLAGQNICDLISVIHHNEDLLPGLIAHMDTCGAERIKLPDEALIRCHGTAVQFFVSGCLLRLECGRYLLSFRNTMDEVTREHILRMVLVRTGIFPWFFDTDRNRMLIDSHWFSYLGIPAGDYTLTSEEFFERVHPDERKMLADALRRQLSEKEIPDSFAYRLRRGDGTWEWFSEQSMYLSRTGDGSPYRVVGVCQSIQEHKTTEKTLREARNKAQESDRLKTAFLANMSHEIRTPLNAIVGFSGLLAGADAPTDSRERQEYAELIDRNCSYLLTLVSDILDLSRMESDTMDFRFAECSPAECLREIYEKYADRIPQGVCFSLRLPPEGTRIVTDVLRLRQVAEHLLDNALKFTRKGEITLGCTPTADGVQFFVADTGCGIEEKQVEKIFDRFYKIDPFMQGAGLGLSVCKTIAEGLGGTIGVTSRPGEGSRFTLSLPLRPPGEAPDKAAGQRM